MTTEDRPTEVADTMTTESALEQWRQAERAASVARRGRVAARAAAEVAEQAADAAAATATAAKSALTAMELAETSASKTASSARLYVQEASSELADSVAEVAMTELAETKAQQVYRDAIDRAEGRKT